MQYVKLVSDSAVIYRVSGDFSADILTFPWLRHFGRLRPFLKMNEGNFLNHLAACDAACPLYQGVNKLADFHKHVH
jgi:hypothetical protein